MRHVASIRRADAETKVNGAANEGSRRVLRTPGYADHPHCALACAAVAAVQLWRRSTVEAVTHDAKKVSRDAVAARVPKMPSRSMPYLPNMWVLTKDSTGTSAHAWITPRPPRQVEAIRGQMRPALCPVGHEGV
jgi:hypothetical protein